MNGINADAEWYDLPTRYGILVTQIAVAFKTFRQLKARSQATLGGMLSENEELDAELRDLCSRVPRGVYAYGADRYELKDVICYRRVDDPDKLIWVHGELRSTDGVRVARCTLSAFLRVLQAKSIVRISSDDSDEDVLKWLGENPTLRGCEMLSTDQALL